MTYRPTAIERAFILAASGRVSTLKEVRETLRSEGYSDEGQLYGGTMQKQLMKLIAKAKADGL